MIEPYVAALETEVGRAASGHRSGPLQTVYLGGGTPSMLSPAQIARLLSTVERTMGLASGAEVSMEAHPSTVDDARLAGFRAAGVNRISFGLESLHSRELESLGRHGATHPSAREAVQGARRAGFESLAVDLIYGIPLQTTESWAETLTRVVESAPDHLSLYPLSVEPRTVLRRRVARDQVVLPGDEDVVRMYFLACDVLARAGYVHYEVGSWCRLGHESQHNLAYWRNREYFGLGVGAHGHVRGRRTVNLRQTARYIARMRAGESAIEECEEIDAETARAETIMLNLRLLREGLDLDRIEDLFGRDLRTERAGELAALEGAGMIQRDESRVFLNESAVPVANEIWERLAL